MLRFFGFVLEVFCFGLVFWFCCLFWGVFFLVFHFNFPFCPWNEILTRRTLHFLLCNMICPFHFCQKMKVDGDYLFSEMIFKEYFGFLRQMATARTVSIPKCETRIGPHAFSAESQVPVPCDVYSQHLLQWGVKQKDLISLGKFCHFHVWFIKKRQSYSLLLLVFFVCVFVCACVGVGVFFVCHWMHLEMLTFYFDVHYQNNKLWNSQYWHVHICLFIGHR